MDKKPALFGSIIAQNQDFFAYSSLKPPPQKEDFGFLSNSLLKTPAFQSFFPENPLKSEDFSSFSPDELKVELFFLLEELFNRKLDEIFVLKPEKTGIFQDPEILVFLNKLISLNLFVLKQDLRIEYIVKLLVFLLRFQRKNDSFIEFLDLVQLLVLGIIRYFSTIPEVFQRNEGFFRENALYKACKIEKNVEFVEDLAIYVLKKSFFSAKNLQFQQKSLNYLLFLVEFSGKRCEESKSKEIASFLRDLKRIFAVFLGIFAETEEKSLIFQVISSEDSQENSFFSFALRNILSILPNYCNFSAEIKQIIEKIVKKALKVRKN